MKTFEVTYFNFNPDIKEKTSTMEIEAKNEKEAESQVVEIGINPISIEEK